MDAAWVGVVGTAVGVVGTLGAQWLAHRDEQGREGRARKDRRHEHWLDRRFDAYTAYLTAASTACEYASGASSTGNRDDDFVVWVRRLQPTHDAGGVLTLLSPQFEEQVGEFGIALFLLWGASCQYRSDSPQAPRPKEFHEQMEQAWLEKSSETTAMLRRLRSELSTDLRT